MNKFLVSIEGKLTKLTKGQRASARATLKPVHTKNGRGLTKETVLLILPVELQEIYILAKVTYEEWCGVVRKINSLSGPGAGEQLGPLELQVMSLNCEWRMLKKLFSFALRMHLLSNGFEPNPEKIGVRMGWKVVTWDHEERGLNMLGLAGPQDLDSLLPPFHLLSEQKPKSSLSGPSLATLQAGRGGFGND